MTFITKDQLKCLHTIISKAGIPLERKVDMCMGFSDGRTTSSRELYDYEAKAMIAHLKSLDPEEKGKQKMIGKILYYAHEMQWTVWSRKSEVGSLKSENRKPITDNRHLVADIDRINAWCEKYSYLKKKLDDYTYSELPKLVSQFQNVYKSFLKTL